MLCWDCSLGEPNYLILRVRHTCGMASPEAVPVHSPGCDIHGLVWGIGHTIDCDTHSATCRAAADDLHQNWEALQLLVPCTTTGEGLAGCLQGCCRMTCTL